MLKYDTVTFELYFVLTHEGSNVSRTEMKSWEIYLSYQTNTQTVISYIQHEIITKNHTEQTTDDRH